MGLFKIQDVSLNSDIQEPIKTKTLLDELFSVKGGIMPSGITMIPGKAGIGKTTLCIEIVKTVKINNPDKNVLFISVEMNKIHLYRYSKRLNFSQIPIFVFDDDESIISQFENILNKGWDLIFVDSFQQLVNIMSVYDKISTKQAEVKVLKAVDSCRLGNNTKQLNTVFLMTMHMTKTGSFAGSAYIKYMIDAMLELSTDEDNEFLTYLCFSKNRDGKTNIRLYFSITETGIEYNYSRYKEDVAAAQLIRKEEKYKDESNDIFNQVFDN